MYFACFFAGRRLSTLRKYGVYVQLLVIQWDGIISQKLSVVTRDYMVIGGNCAQ